MPLVRLGLFACLTAGLGAQENAAWSFRGEAQPDLQASGAVTFVQPGPRRPDYPTFDLKNQAARFDGKGARLMLADSPDHRFDFTNGDAITLEAWVKLDGLRKGSNVYLIGKGRTKAGSSNQNWALRLREMYGSACPSFLFATTPAAGDQGGIIFIGPAQLLPAAARARLVLRRIFAVNKMWRMRREKARDDFTLLHLTSGT